MSLFNLLFRGDAESRQLLQSTSRTLILTIGGLYLIWHFIATLTWSQTFSPSLWSVSVLMICVVVAALRLLTSHFVLAQFVWLGGLMAATFLAYSLYQQPIVLFLLAFLPLIAIVTIGMQGALVTVAAVWGITSWLPGNWMFPALPVGYTIGIVLGSTFTAVFGWGLSNNLLSALEAASYHFHEARRLLDETRERRAEISRMLKDREQTNYQLERLNQMLHFARVRAEEARADRDRFILAVSHELRSPLNLIIGFTDLMVKSPDTYAELRKWPPGLYDDIQDVFRSSTHLLSLINDILDLGQVDARQMTLLREKTRIEQVCEEVVRLAQPAYAQKGLWLQAEIEGDLPEVLIDRTRIRQVLLNLVNNSLRFTETGGVTLRVQSQPENLLISVIDTGIGIQPEDIPKVFDEFRQVGAESWHRRSGSGLGLSISRSFVQLHGGKIWLESEPGKGTRFCFTLPRSDGATSSLAGVESLSGVFDPMVGSTEKLILLLSRNPHARLLAQQWLPGFRWQVVDLPEQLPEYMIKLLPYAILVDRTAFPEALKGLPYDLPVIRLVFPGLYPERSLPEGVAAYLVKPVPWQNLAEVLQSVVPEAKRLLFVDDDPAMLRLFSHALRAVDSGVVYDILQVETGEQALECLQRQSFDVVLLDLDLPDIAGWKVLEAIQQGRTLNRPPVVIISALDPPQMRSLNGQSVLELVKVQHLTADELSAALKALLEAIQPTYPTLSGSNEPTSPTTSAG